MADYHQAKTLYDRGIDQKAKGQFPAAQLSLKLALVLFEALLGPDHVTVALCCNQLALVLFTQAAFAQAAALYQRALVIFETNHGPDHPEVATVLCNWGEMLSNPKVMLRKRGP